MITKQEFSQSAFATIGDYPTLEILYQAKDPRLLQHIDAIATMLSMFSAQLEVAQAEPFEKTKQSTVLADAAMRGVIPKAVPTVLSIKIENDAVEAVSIGAGRILLDSSGRSLRVDSSVSVNAKSTGYVTATQLYDLKTVHTVTESRPFYEIPLPMKHEESLLSGVRVFDEAGNEYTYSDRYVAINADEKVFHIEVDEKQNFYVRFGYKGIVGVQPPKNAQITVQAFYTFGLVASYSQGDQIVFEVNQSLNDAYVKLSIDAVKTVGEAPISTAVLRELTKYPSVYNKNAVYLGEFDYLIRSNFPHLAFLSVWNEAAEEIARAPSTDNINSLFIAVVGDTGQEGYDLYAPGKKPTEVTQLTPLQQSIKTAVYKADDTYRVRFFRPLVREIAVSITANVSTSYDQDVVKKQIQTAVIEKYGQDSVVMSRGKAKPKYQDLYNHIKKNVSALAVGSADLKIVLEDLGQFDAYPEIWQYIDVSKLDIVVNVENVSTNSWGVGF